MCNSMGQKRSVEDVEQHVAHAHAYTLFYITGTTNVKLQHLEQNEQNLGEAQHQAISLAMGASLPSNGSRRHSLSVHITHCLQQHMGWCDETNRASKPGSSWP